MIKKIVVPPSNTSAKSFFEHISKRKEEINKKLEIKLSKRLAAQKN